MDVNDEWPMDFLEFLQMDDIIDIGWLDFCTSRVSVNNHCDCYNQ